MPFNFAIIAEDAITDPNGALVTNPGTESDNGAAGVGSPISFGTAGAPLVTTAAAIDEDILTDDTGNNLSEAITIGGQTFAAGSDVETDYSFVAQDTATGIYYRISHVTINNQYVGAIVSRGFDASLTNPADPNSVVGLVGKYPAGTTLQIVDPDPVSNAPAWEAFVVESNYNLGPNQAYDNDVDLTSDGSTIICFGEGTMILMSDGTECAVEDIAVGDSVRAHMAEPKKVLWIGRRSLSAAELKAAPSLCPIRITEGSLGKGVPTHDLLVSPQHRMLLNSPIVSRMMGVESCLVPAKHLLGLPGVDKDVTEQGVTYFHILLEDHQVIYANGAPSESLFLGAEALKSLRREAREEIAALFPETLSPDWSPPTNYTFIGRGKTQRLLWRHIKNDVPLAFAKAA